MGQPAPIGVGGVLASPAGDQANIVVTGQLTSVAPGKLFPSIGPFNASLWASINTTLTTTAGSVTSTVASPTGLANGVAIKSTLVPPGTTIGNIVGSTVTLALPTVVLTGFVSTSAAAITGLPTSYALATLVGSTISGPGIPTGTTVVSVNAAAGSAVLSAAPTAGTSSTSPQFFSFALTGNAVLGGADSSATFTGASIVWSGTVNIEKSFDGGSTWVVYSTSTSPITIAITENELGVYYRANCTTYTSGTINYRFSITGRASSTFAQN